MQKIFTTIQSIEESVREGGKDFSLLTELQRNLFPQKSASMKYKIDNDYVGYSRVMLKVYDISNHHHLYSVGEGRVHSLGIRLKIVVIKVACTIIGILMQKFPDHKQNSISKQLIQIVAISTRVLLDNSNCIKQIRETHKYSELVFKQHKQEIGVQIYKLYLLNQLQIIKYNIEEQHQVPQQVQLLQHNIKNIYHRNPNHQESQFVNYIVSDVVLTLLREGKLQHTKILQPYLPSSYLQSIHSISQPNHNTNHNHHHMNKYYSLYQQITLTGIDEISQQSLQEYLNKKQLYETQEIFDIIILTREPILLKIWFSSAYSMGITNITKGYQCFIKLFNIYLLDTISQAITLKLLQLCRYVILTILRQKKQNIMIYKVIYTILSFMIKVVSIAHNNIDTMLQVFQNITIVSNKYNYIDILKTLSSLHFYYELTHKIYKDSTYRKFIKYYDKNQLNLVMKASYELKQGIIREIDEHISLLVHRKPQYSILLQAYNQLVILDIEMEEFMKIDNPFQIYTFLLLKYAHQYQQMTTQNLQESQQILKIAHHMQNFFLKSHLSSLVFKLTQIQQLIKILTNIIHQHNNKEIVYIKLIIYCEGLLNLPSSIFATDDNFGVVLNKFSKLLKIIQLINLRRQILVFFKILITKKCQKMKEELLSLGKVHIQAGEFIFLKILYQKAILWEEDQGPDYQFLTFNIFEIFSMYNREQELQELLLNNENIEKIFLKSKVVPNKIKIRIMRKIIRKSLSLNQKPQISMQDMRMLTLSAQSIQQGSLYVGYMINLFGEQGKKLISLLSQENDKIQSYISTFKKHK